jgi:hypothetical protein
MKGIQFYPQSGVSFNGRLVRGYARIEMCPDSDAHECLPDFLFAITSSYEVEVAEPLLGLMDVVQSRLTSFDPRRTAEKRRNSGARDRLLKIFYQPTDVFSLRHLAIVGDLESVVRLREGIEGRDKMKKSVHGGVCFEFDYGSTNVMTASMALDDEDVGGLVYAYQDKILRAVEGFIDEYEIRTSKDRHLTRIGGVLKRKFIRERIKQLGLFFSQVDAGFIQDAPKKELLSSVQ